MASIIEQLIDRYNHNYTIREEDLEYLESAHPEEVDLIVLIRAYVYDNLTVSNPQPNQRQYNKRVLYFRREGDIAWETGIVSPRQFVLFDVGAATRIVQNFVLIRDRESVLQVLRCLEALVNTGFIFFEVNEYGVTLRRIARAYPGQVNARYFDNLGEANFIDIFDLSEQIQGQSNNSIQRINISFGSDTFHHLPTVNIPFAIRNIVFSRFRRPRGGDRERILFVGTHPSGDLVRNDFIPWRRIHHPRPDSIIILPISIFVEPASARVQPPAAPRPTARRVSLNEFDQGVVNIGGRPINLSEFDTGIVDISPVTSPDTSPLPTSPDTSPPPSPPFDVPFISPLPATPPLSSESPDTFEERYSSPSPGPSPRPSPPGPTILGRRRRDESPDDAERRRRLDSPPPVFAGVRRALDEDQPPSTRRRRLGPSRRVPRPGRRDDVSPPEGPFNPLVGVGRPIPRPDLARGTGPQARIVRRRVRRLVAPRPRPPPPPAPPPPPPPPPPPAARPARRRVTPPTPPTPAEVITPPSTPPEVVTPDTDDTLPPGPLLSPPTTSPDEDEDPLPTLPAIPVAPPPPPLPTPAAQPISRLQQSNQIELPPFVDLDDIIPSDESEIDPFPTDLDPLAIDESPTTSPTTTDTVDTDIDLGPLDEITTEEDSPPPDDDPPTPDDFDEDEDEDDDGTQPGPSQRPSRITQPTRPSAAPRQANQFNLAGPSQPTVPAQPVPTISMSQAMANIFGPQPSGPGQNQFPGGNQNLIANIRNALQAINTLRPGTVPNINQGLQGVLDILGDDNDDVTDDQVADLLQNLFPVPTATDPTDPANLSAALFANQPPLAPNSQQQRNQLIQTYLQLLMRRFRAGANPEVFALEVFDIDDVSQRRAAIRFFTWAGLQWLQNINHNDSDPIWEWIHRFLNAIQTFHDGLVFGPDDETLADLILGGSGANQNVALLERLNNLSPDEVSEFLQELQAAGQRLIAILSEDNEFAVLNNLRAIQYLIIRLQRWLRSRPNPNTTDQQQSLNEALREQGVTPLGFTNPADFGRFFGQLIYTQAEMNWLRQLIGFGGDWAANIVRNDGTSCTIALNGPRSQLEQLIRLLLNSTSLQPIEFLCVSETEFIIPVNVDSVTIWQITSTATRNAIIGFLPYCHDTKLDLTRYQVYHMDDRPEYHESCLIHSLKQTGLFSEDKIEGLLTRLPQGYNVAKHNLHDIAKYLGATIYLHQGTFNKELTKVERTWNYTYGNGPIKVKLAALLNHVFIREKTKYYAYGVDHYDEIKDLPNWDKIYCSLNAIGKKGKKKGQNMYRISHKPMPSRQISSYLLMCRLFNKGHFQRCNTNIHHPSTNLICSLKNCEADQSKFEFRARRPSKKPKMMFYCDLECDTQTAVYHQPIIAAASYRDPKGEPQFIQYYGINCVKELLTRIGKFARDYDVVMGFHNLLYDFSAAAAHLEKVYNAVIKDGKLYKVCVLHCGVSMTMVDTFKIISESLKKFEKMFDLDIGKKEMIAYNYYTIDNVPHCGSRLVNLKEFAKEFDKEENGGKGAQAFINHVKSDDELKRFIYGEDFDYVAYYAWYNMYDCEVLRKGMEKFGRQMRDFCLKTTGVRLNINDFLTISSFANYYVSLRGCYKGVYEVSGGLRNYIQEAIKGGRVVGNEKYMKKVIDSDLIDDFDVTSLYPHAIEEIGNNMGYPQGIATELQENEDPWQYRWFIVRIKINSIGKYQQLPMINRREEDKMCWYNAGDQPEGYFTVGRIGLEDWINFCNIDYEIKDGIAWKTNAPSNNKCATVIRELFELRKKYKAENNNTQICIKLLQNSIYGKTCETRTDKLVCVESGDNVKSTICKKFGLFKRALHFGNNKHSVIEFATYDISFVKNHIGVQILEMSKRVMNRVLNLAQDNNIAMLYTDTDSLHLFRKDVPKLNQLFSLAYHKVLVGNDLGQFHSDFADLKCRHGKPVSVKFIMLAPKVYCDKLMCEQCQLTDMHYKMKGVPQFSIEDAAKEYEDIFAMYVDMASGTQMKFNLNPPKKVRFDCKIGRVRTMLPNTFERCITV